MGEYINVVETFGCDVFNDSVMQARLPKKIYKELLEHPKTGLGHPEALRGGGDITWSRHITAHDRIIYDIYEEVVEVYILEVEGHYNDK